MLLPLLLGFSQRVYVCLGLPIYIYIDIIGMYAYPEKEKGREGEREDVGKVEVYVRLHLAVCGGKDASAK